MGLKFTLKDIQEETRLVRFRVYTAALIIILLVMVLIGRLFYLQVIRHDHFTTLSQSNRVKVLPIPPIRGLVFSRDGVLVADNQPSFSLELIPEQIESLDKTIDELSGLMEIDEESINRFKKLRQAKRRFESIPLKFKLSEHEVARFSVERHKFPGVEVVARPYRHYPEKSGLVHVLGYVGRIDEKDLQSIDESDYLGTSHIGKLGVEKAYEVVLHGHVGHQQVEVNAQGRIIRVLERTPPIPGQNIHLTLDYSLQPAATNILQGRRGSIVAIDPNNGDILALVSSPAYDPNPFVNGIDSKSYKALLSAKDTPLINRALNGKYPPGSTIKPFLGIAALTTGVREASDTTWCKGWYSLKGHSHRYRDWKKTGHGHVDLNYAIMQSCDVYYYTLAHDLGITRLNKALTNFGFGNKTGIDIGGESSGLVPSIEWKRRALNQPWYPGETLLPWPTMVNVSSRDWRIKPAILFQEKSQACHSQLQLMLVITIRKIGITSYRQWRMSFMAPGALPDVVVLKLLINLPERQGRHRLSVSDRMKSMIRRMCRNICATTHYLLHLLPSRRL